jgi:hypothetical protein
MRLRSDFWAAAYIRRCEVEGASAYLRRRGAAEAGAVIVKLDCLDGRCALYGLAPQNETDRGVNRRFLRLHKAEWIDPADAEARLKRETGFDSDLWILEIEDRAGRVFLDVAE